MSVQYIDDLAEVFEDDGWHQLRMTYETLRSVDAHPANMPEAGTAYAATLGHRALGEVAGVVPAGVSNCAKPRQSQSIASPERTWTTS